MATYSGPTLITLKADSDLSSYQYHVVMSASTADTVQLLSASTSVAPIGILWNDPDTAGEAAAVAILGEAKVAASATSAISPGSWLYASSDGKARAGTVGTNITFAVALEGLSSGSAIIRCLLLGVNVPA